MPRLPIDYSNAVIYKLSCKDKSITEIYIGSTTHFTNRKNQHKTSCNNSNNKVENKTSEICHFRQISIFAFIIIRLNL